jgi:hypothetical protein
MTDVHATLASLPDGPPRRHLSAWAAHAPDALAVLRAADPTVAPLAFGELWRRVARYYVDATSTPTYVADTLSCALARAAPIRELWPAELQADVDLHMGAILVGQGQRSAATWFLARVDGRATEEQRLRARMWAFFADEQTEDDTLHDLATDATTSLGPEHPLAWEIRAFAAVVPTASTPRDPAAVEAFVDEARVRFGADSFEHLEALLHAWRCADDADRADALAQQGLARVSAQPPDVRARLDFHRVQLGVDVVGSRERRRWFDEVLGEGHPTALAARLWVARALLRADRGQEALVELDLWRCRRLAPASRTRFRVHLARAHALHLRGDTEDARAATTWLRREARRLGMGAAERDRIDHLERELQRDPTPEELWPGVALPRWFLWALAAWVLFLLWIAE